MSEYSSSLKFYKKQCIKCKYYNFFSVNLINWQIKIPSHKIHFSLNFGKPCHTKRHQQVSWFCFQSSFESNSLTRARLFSYSRVKYFSIIGDTIRSKWFLQSCARTVPNHRRTLIREILIPNDVIVVSWLSITLRR